jgi:hypothetical protein
MMAGPADLTLDGQSLAMIGGDFGSFAERLGDLRSVRFWVFAPFLDAELGRIDPDCAVFAHAMFLEHTGNSTSHAHGAEKLFPRLCISHRRIADRAGPDRRDNRADAETVPLNKVGDFLQFVVAGVRIGVRQEKEVVNPVELLAVHLRAGGQFEHPFETDWWFLARFISFADQSRPHGVVKSGEGIRTHL